VLALYTYVCACYSNDEGMRNYSNSIKKKKREREGEKNVIPFSLSLSLTELVIDRDIEFVLPALIM